MFKKVAYITFFAIIVLGLIYYLYLSLNQSDQNRSEEKEKTSASSSIQYGFPFPFEITFDQAEKSLLNNEKITTQPVEDKWLKEIENTAYEKKWDLLSIDFKDDGGSKIFYYFKSKTDPGVEIAFFWNKDQGQYDLLEVNFVKPDQLGLWLLDLKENSSLGNDVNIEELLDCSGTYLKLDSGLAECQSF